jgi:sulfur-oxidizing protein SoxY
VSRQFQPLREPEGSIIFVICLELTTRKYPPSRTADTLEAGNRPDGRSAFRSTATGISEYDISRGRIWRNPSLSSLFYFACHNLVSWEIVKGSWRRDCLACCLGLRHGLPIPVFAMDRVSKWQLRCGIRTARLVAEVFEHSAEEDGGKVIALDTLYRADDGAMVPVTIRTRLSRGDRRRVRRITLVIDNNPAPVAAVIEPGATSSMDTWSTRVRVDSDSDVHAVAEMSDGALYMATRYVKAAGGCSAPASEQEADPASVGAMRFRVFAPIANQATTDILAAGPYDPSPPRSGRVKTEEVGASASGGSGTPHREAHIMIRHPNHSGLQRDQITQLYIPAHFIRRMRVWQGDDLLFSVEGGISLSENPRFRFGFVPNRAKIVRAEAIDTEHKMFEQAWSADIASM